MRISLSCGTGRFPSQIAVVTKGFVGETRTSFIVERIYDNYLQIGPTIGFIDLALL
jgi:hypothetical protein